MRIILITAAIAVGLLIAYFDSRPNWDDTGVTAGVVFLASATFAFLGKNRPWLWAVAVGIWIPMTGILISRNYGSLLALLVALGGAYAGMIVRLALQTDWRQEAAHSSK